MTDLIRTPVLAAALAKKPRRRPRKAHPRGEGGNAKAQNNFIAQAPKKKAGAPLGNRNAAIRDPQVLERRAHHSDMRALIRHAHGMAGAAVVAARFGEVGRAIVRAALAEGRDG